MENKPYMRAMQELRRSNAAQRHVPQHRKGTRRARKNSAIREAREG